MDVTVVRVCEMRVGILDRFVTVSMGVVLSGSQDNTWLMRVVVLVVFVMRMFMRVIHGLVDMRMFVFLRQVHLLL
ncbi:MAG: hypothetical protein CK604_05940 [Curvibacter sp. PD_MW3]|nr:MAG: hypothetical protein CK604_05940 [Curvibacter sp. PD_MW3]